MLGYVNEGLRRYGKRPIFRYPRGAVEFQIVCSGYARPVSNTGIARKTKPPCLWVHGPDSDHGWTDDPNGISRIIVFHFSEVHPVLQRVLDKESPLARTLTPREMSRIRSIHAELLPHAQHMHQASPVWMAKANAELTLMALSGLPEERMRDPDRHAESKVAQAIAWYREQLGQAPTISDVAQAVSLSPPHLRRLFHKVKGVHPHKAFHVIRMSAAMHLLREGTFRVSEISDRLGFSEPAAFTRAFRKHFRESPSSILRRS